MLRVRLGIGFALVIGIVTALGGISFLLFRGVSGNVRTLDEFHMPAAQRATNIERHALQAFDLEGDFFEKGDDSAEAGLLQHLDAMTKDLKALGELARSHDRAPLLDKSVATALAIVEQYGNLFRRGVASRRQAADQGRQMDEKGDLTSQEVDSLVARKRSEYSEAKDALAAANTVNATALDMQVHGKGFMLDRDPTHLAAVERDAEAVLEGLRSLEKGRASQLEKTEIDRSRGTIQDYLKAIRAWAAQWKSDPKSGKLAELTTAMNRAGDVISQTMDDYMTSKQDMVEKISMAFFLGREVGQSLLNARLGEKDYLHRKDPNCWEIVNLELEKLDGLYDRLRKSAPSKDDSRSIDRASAATAQYRQAATAWFAHDRELRSQLLPEMKKRGLAVVATAQRVEEDSRQSASRATANILELVSRSNVVIALAVGIAIAAGATLAWRITRAITRPLMATVAMLQDIAEGEGDLTRRLEIATRDELGELARWFNTFVEKVQRTVQQIARRVQSLQDASRELSSTSTQLASGAEETTRQSGCVADSARQLSANMDGIAASSAEMSTNLDVIAASVDALNGSICEIARSAQQAADAAKDAARRIDVSNTELGGLGDAAHQIGEIIEVIQGIAEQTNLLALNATIEAARAGDNGRGFAVVATEVKELARQTSSASEDIRRRVQAIQGSTEQAIHSIEAIGGTIKQVRDLSQTMAAAVEEQSITTREIASNTSRSTQAAQQVNAGVTQSATASGEIRTNIEGVDEAARQSAQGAVETQNAGMKLARIAEEFQRLVGQFNA